MRSRETDDAIHVAAALEQYAVEYKRNIDAPYFLRARKVVVDYFIGSLTQKSRVLDINCGTGIDSIEIARRGHLVKAVDVSSAMISFATEAIDAAGLAAVASAEVGDYRSLPTPSQPFDAAISDFGGINFSAELDRVFDSARRNLAEGGLFLVNSVSRFSLLEFLAFALKGKFRTAARRPTGGRATIGGKRVLLYYHSRRSFIRAAMKNGFHLVDSFGLNIFAPPLWADHFFSSHPDLAAFLERLDDKTRRTPVLRSIGDFTVLVFRTKKG